MADLDQLLQGSSRTFALTIPLLPEPARREVTVAYLLFRVADTLEDAERWPRARRAGELARFESLLCAEQLGLEPLAERWPENDRQIAARIARYRDDPPSLERGYQALMEELSAVIEALRALEAPSREVILKHLLVTVRGMAQGLREEDDELFKLRSLAQLQRYCYLVAGVVGEMLTELFLLHAPLASAAAALRAASREFGEGLQLTNILKDAGEDAQEQRQFIPDKLTRASLFSLARRDLTAAIRYVAALLYAQAPSGMVAFTALPVRLAIDTLREVERRGAGAKVSREQLALAMDEVFALLRGERKLEAVLHAPAEP